MVSVLDIIDLQLGGVKAKNRLIIVQLEQIEFQPIQKKYIPLLNSKATDGMRGNPAIMKFFLLTHHRIQIHGIHLQQIKTLVFLFGINLLILLLKKRA